MKKRNPFLSFLRLLWKIGDFVSHFTIRYGDWERNGRCSDFILFFF